MDLDKRIDALGLSEENSDFLKQYMVTLSYATFISQLTTAFSELYEVLGVESRYKWGYSGSNDIIGYKTSFDRYYEEEKDTLSYDLEKIRNVLEMLEEKRRSSDSEETLESEELIELQMALEGRPGRNLQEKIFIKRMDETLYIRHFFNLSDQQILAYIKNFKDFSIEDYVDLFGSLHNLFKQEFRLFIFQNYLDSSNKINIKSRLQAVFIKMLEDPKIFIKVYGKTRLGRAKHLLAAKKANNNAYEEKYKAKPLNSIEPFPYMVSLPKNAEGALNFGGTNKYWEAKPTWGKSFVENLPPAYIEVKRTGAASGKGAGAGAGASGGRRGRKTRRSQRKHRRSTRKH